MIPFMKLCVGRNKLDVSFGERKKNHRDLACDQTQDLVITSHADTHSRGTEACLLITEQARRQGEFEGVRLNPPFDLQIMIYTPLNSMF